MVTDKKIEALIKQYEQMSQEVRHYDTQMYVTPPTLLTILGVALNYVTQRPDNILKVAILGFLIIICHTFAVLFAKQSIHQRAARNTLTKLEDEIGLIKMPRTTFRSPVMKHIPSIEYYRWSPIGIYFSSSADRSILLMFMFSMGGVLFYLLKTILDLSWQTHNLVKMIIAVASATVIGSLYVYFVSSRPNETEYTRNIMAIGNVSHNSSVSNIEGDKLVVDR